MKKHILIRVSENRTRLEYGFDYIALRSGNPIIFSQYFEKRGFDAPFFCSLQVIAKTPRSPAVNLSLIPVKIKITFVAAAPYCASPLECDAAHVSVHAVVAKAESTCQFLAT